jgi:Domain of unknown function (DUF4337)
MTALKRTEVRRLTRKKWRWHAIIPHLPGVNMSDNEFEVHGPHDHALEHATEHGRGDPFASRVAVMAALLATMGAVFSYQSGNTENQALIYKNEAAIRKTDAANQWAYYQSKGQKQNLAELGAALSTRDAPSAARFASEAARYKQEKEPIRAKAEALEQQVETADKQSEALVHRHHRWAQATTLIQVAIALSAITLLARSRWLFVGAAGMAVLGVATAVLAAAHI